MFPANFIDLKNKNKKYHYCDNDIYRNHCMLSYSQEGEDIILRHIFSGTYKGCYVDIGAHHPTRFSNTRFFYEQDWSGINIDPNPGIMNLFNEVRPRDINLELGVSDSHGLLPYYSFNEPALNTFNTEYAQSILKQTSIHLFEEIFIEVYPLSSILERYLGGRSIDFMSIDTEEFELKVLASNDWDRFRPKAIVIECLSAELENFRDCPIYEFLSARDYSLYAKTIKSYIFKNKRA